MRYLATIALALLLGCDPMPEAQPEDADWTLGEEHLEEAKRQGKALPMRDREQKRRRPYSFEVTPDHP